MKKKKPEPSFFKLRFRTRPKKPGSTESAIRECRVRISIITRHYSGSIQSGMKIAVKFDSKKYKNLKGGKARKMCMVRQYFWVFFFSFHIFVRFLLIYSCSWKPPSPIYLPRTTLNQPFRLILVSYFSKDLVFAGFAVHNFCRGSDYAISIPRSGFKAGDADPG